ncbi:hypothetical protein Tco_1228437 [Tanacetum coccineum]
MPPKRTSTSAAPAMTQDAIRQLVADSVATALKVQAASMASASNPNKNTGISRTPVARKGINDHKRKFEDRGNTTNNTKHNNNNHSNNRNNNNYQDNTTKTTITMITTNSRIEDKKPSKLILPPMDILEIVPCVKDAPYIT